MTRLAILTAAAAVGVTQPTFNGLSILAAIAALLVIASSLGEVNAR